MAKNEGNKLKPGHKHPLLVYRFIGGRYRPAGVLLFLLGLLLQIPRLLPLIPAPKPLTLPTALPAETLSLLGLAVLFSGAGLWLLSLLIARRSYVRCQPDFMVIHAPFNTVAVAYSRIVSNQLVQVNKIYDLEKLKGREKTIIRPLLAESAVEMEINDWPLPEKRLHRYFTRFLFSTREKGFIFIVPAPTNLNNEIGTYMQDALDRREAAQRRYLDPLERARNSKPGQYR
jgi:hypothetical protein